MKTGIVAGIVLALLTPWAAHADDRETLYMVGDSITQGSGTTDPETKGYPALLRGAGSRIRVVAQGGRCLVYGGCPGIPLVEKFQDRVLDRAVKPDHAVVAIGVNDLAHVTDAQLRRGFRLLVRSGRDAGVQVHIATITPTSLALAMYPREWVEPQRQRINRWIRRTWPNNHLDFAAALEGRGRAMRAVYDYGDGLHPNDKGAEALAEVVREKLQDRHP